MRVWYACILALCVGAPSARATVLVPADLGDLSRSAVAIARGRVAAVDSQWTDDHRAIETVVSLEVDEYLKGSMGPVLRFRVPGGRLGRYRSLFVGAPEFKQGDEVVLFLKYAGPSYPYIVGLSQGAFRVVTEPGTGRRMVTTPVVMGTGGEAPERVVRGDPGRRPLPMDRFRESVREVLGSGPAR